MACSNSSCTDKSLETPLFPCLGPCGNLFHAKCVGTTNAFLDKILKSKIAYWYCPNCKKISLTNLAFKLSSMKAELKKITKGFDELTQGIFQLNTSLDSVSLPTELVDKSCSTDDLDLASNTPKQSSSSNAKTTRKRARDAATSFVNAGPAPKKSNLRSNNEEGTKNSNSIGDLPPIVDVVNQNLDKTTNFSNSKESVSHSVDLTTENSDRPTNSCNPNDPTNPLPNEHSKNTLLSVPKPKTIFISRLLPETKPDDILNHLLDCKVISSLSQVKCLKISKPNSFVASFKITAPSNLFEAICNCSWPPHTLVKEFSAPVRKSQVRVTVSPNESKNCKGSPSTIKT